MLIVHFAYGACLLVIHCECLPAIGDPVHPLKLNHAPHVEKFWGEVCGCEGLVFLVPNLVPFLSLCLSLVP
jgi:hypothetical protein